MHFLKIFFIKTVKYKLINKFIYKKVQKLPEFKKIILNFSSKTVSLKKLFASLLALELITNQKGVFTTTKNSNISIKIKKGNPVGCKLTLQKHKFFRFFSTIVLKILPKFKNISKFILNLDIKNGSLFFNFYNNNFSFSELEKHYYFFNSLPNLNITILASTKTKKELLFFCKLLQFID